MLIVTVCRSGPEYGARQAHFLHDQLGAWKTDAVCLSDMELEGIERIPLQHTKMPGWWSKMELFDPEGPLGGESFFYVDLDTKIVGDLALLFGPAYEAGKLVMLRDFYQPELFASGVMYIPAGCKAAIWSGWQQRYRKFMWNPLGRGDGGAIEALADSPIGWQDIAPGRIVSFKKHVVAPGNRWFKPGLSEGDGSMPGGAVLCCYHGKPRPW